MITFHGRPYIPSYPDKKKQTYLSQETIAKKLQKRVGQPIEKLGYVWNCEINAYTMPDYVDMRIALLHDYPTTFWGIEKS